MQLRSLCLSALVVLSGHLSAQTQVVVSHVQLIEKESMRPGSDVTIQLSKDEGSERQVIYAEGDITAKTWVKVSTHNVRRSSLKDSAVNLIFEIDLVVGKDKDNKRVEKIFYLDQSRTGKVSQRFTFKDGIRVRVITLAFDVELK
jgi:hypothetical protein